MLPPLPLRELLGALALTESLTDAPKDRAASLGRLRRTLTFLDFSVADVSNETGEFHARSAAFVNLMAGGGGPRDMSSDEFAMYLANGMQTELLTFRIESFYVFARVLLDDVVVVIDNLCRSQTTIGSHSEISKKLPLKVAEKGLEPVDRLLELADELNASIKVFRDKHVVHVRNPRQGQGITWSGDRSVRLAPTHAYPTQAEMANPLPVSDAPADLLLRIEAYLEELLRWMDASGLLPKGPLTVLVPGDAQTTTAGEEPNER